MIDEPVYILGSIIHTKIRNWLVDNELFARLRNGFDLLIFEAPEEDCMFNLVFGENIEKFGQ